MNSIPQNMLRALRFTVKFGNLIYILITGLFVAIGFDVFYKQQFMQGLGKTYAFSMKAFLFFLAIAFIIFFCKILDNAARLRSGMEDEFVPITPTSITPLLRSIHLALAFVSLAYLIFFIPRVIYISLAVFITLLVIVALLLFILAPAMLLATITEGNTKAAFSSQRLGEAISEIDTGRYFAMTAIAFAMFAAYILTDYFLIVPAIQRTIMGDLIQQFMSGKDEQSLTLPTIVHIYSLMTGLIFMTVAFFTHHFYACCFPREDSDDPESFSYGMNAAEMESISAALAGHGVTPPAAEDKSAAPAAVEPLPDFSLLADADTSGMGIETQKAFALALARADALLGSNKIDAGLALLAPYADGAHDAAAYFPAYRRIYALKPEYELLQRLAEAAAHGHAPSFDLIRPELERIDPTTLPADLIYPLAQFAARQQHYPVVLTLTRGFAQHHPDHPQLIDNYLLAARALAKTGHAERAQQLLTQMLTRFASHEKAGQIRATLKLLQAQ
jgi:hypothetical protein